MARVLGDALVRVRPDTSTFAGDTQRGISPGLKKVAGVIAGALSARAVAAGAGAVVKASSNAQQSIGATEQVFKKYSDSVVRNSKRAATNIGLSANEYRELANVTGAMLKSSGMPLEKVAGLTDKLNTRAADMAATFGGTTKEAVEAVSSLLRGETDPIERYGVSLKQSDINARLAAKGQDKLTGSARKQAEAQARLDLLFQQTKDSQGQSAREANQYAGVTQRLGARFSDLQVKIGDQLLPAFTAAAAVIGDKVLPKVSELADRYLPKATAAVTRFIQDFDFDALGARVSAALDGIDWGQVGAQISQVSKDGGKLKPVLSELAAQLPAIRDLFSVTGEAIGFAADHTDLLVKALPYLIAGYAAIKLGQLAANAALVVSLPIKIAELFITRQHTKALAQQTAALGVHRSATAVATATTNGSVLAQVRQRLATVATAVAQRAAAVASRVWAAGQWLLNAALTANPIGLVIAGIVALGAGLVLAYKKSDTFRAIVNKAWAAIKTGLQVAWSYIQPVLAKVASWVGSRLPAVFAAMRKVIGTVLGAAGGYFRTWWSVISGVFSAIKTGVRGVRDVISTIVGKISDIWGGLKSAFSGPVTWIVDNVINKLIGAINSVAGALGKKGNLISPINLGGGGGSNRKGNQTVVGRKDGGPIPGRSPNTRADNIPVAGTAGEWVHRVASVRKYGTGFMDAVNRGRFPLELAHAPAGFAKAIAAGGTDMLRRAKGGLIDTVKPLAGGSPSTYAGHTGVDFNAPNDFGKPILAARAGRVSQTQSLTTSYGKNVRVRHPGGITTIYGHMSQILAKVGQAVKAGTMIGRVGSTGNSSGPHLHFETRPGGTYASAMAFLRGARTVGGNGAGPGVNPLASLKKKLDAIKTATAGIAGKGPLGAIGALARDRLSSMALGTVKAGAKAAGKTGLFGLAGLVASNVFDRGGVARGRGAMIKNTNKPERVLSPKQTSLFDRLVAALDTKRLKAMEQLAAAQKREVAQLRKSRRFKAMDAKGRSNALTDLSDRQAKKRGDTARSLKADQKKELASLVSTAGTLGRTASKAFAAGLAGNREQVAERFEPVMALVAKIGDRKLTQLVTSTRTAVMTVAAQYETALAKTQAAREAAQALRETAVSYSADLAKGGVESGDITGFADTTVKGLAGYLRDAAAKVRGKSDLAARLSKAGLNTTAIGQIVAEGGTRAQSVADSILAGGSAAVKQINELMAGLAKDSAAYGQTAAAAVYGTQIKAADATVRALQAAEAPLAAQMRRLGQVMVTALAKELPGAKSSTKPKGKSVGTAISKTKGGKVRTITKSASFDGGGVGRGIGMLPKRVIRPERVLSPRQTEAFEAWMASGPGKPKGGDITVNQNFPTTATPAATAASAGGRVVDALAAVGFTGTSN